MNYWDVETPHFALQEGPGWLKIDAASGVLCGADRAEKVAVVVTATINREVRSLDSRALNWGMEKLQPASRVRSSRLPWRLDSIGRAATNHS